MAPLFADVQISGEQLAALLAALVPVVALLGAGAKWLIDRFGGWWLARMGYRQKNEQSLIDHLEAAVTRLEREVTEERVRGRAESVRVASLVGHLRYMEALLRNAKIEFIPWTDPGDDPGSGHHHHPLTDLSGGLDL